ncbi:MAG: methylated-DNA--[protein]-cysteine S-methyltransferase [Fibromonadaceae bacterium]|nr:methylated-DNA--[protein]-cysteine S-methyltransferase [Fibromonadaceae bacterium]
MEYISPIGALRIEASERGLRAIRFLPQSKTLPDSEDVPEPSTIERECMALCVSALNSYFAKQWGAFNQLRSKIPLDLKGSDLQKKVWGIIYSLPNTYPITSISYSELARLAGKPNSVRACANICGQNNIPILIPCHRVIAADGKLGGYSSGIFRKSWLLWHEGITIKGPGLLQQPPQAR